MIAQIYEKYIPQKGMILRRDVPQLQLEAGNRFVQNYEQDSYFSVFFKDIFIKVLAKKTPYSHANYEVMFLSGNPEISQVVQFSKEQKANWSEFIRDYATVARSIYKGNDYFLAINQQPECINIPEKFDKFGVEVKVQTINAFHIHLFAYGLNYTKRFCNLGDLELSDRQDFFDPYALDFVNSKLKSKKTEGFMFKYANSGNFMNRLAELHSKYVSNFYNYLQNCIKKPNGELQETLKLLQNKKLKVDRKFYPIQGPGFTFITDPFGGASYFSPKIVSRGNAMEARFVWIDQEGWISENQINDRRNLQKNLFNILSQKYKLKKGPLL